MDKISLAGCAIIKDRKILLIRRLKTGWYELPGGKVESGETAESAAVREIKEELCSDIKIIGRLGKKDFIENGYSMSYTWFQASFVNSRQPVIGEPEKFDDLSYIALAELKNYSLSPNMVNFAHELELGNIKLRL